MLTAQGMSHIVIPVPACLVTQSSYARLTYVVSDPLTDLSRGWNLWLQCGGKIEGGHVTLLALLYCRYGHMQIVVVQQQNYWSVYRRFGIATICSTYLNKWSSVPLYTPMDGPCVKCVECNVLMTNEVHNSYNQFLFHSLLSALHVSNESSRSSSGAQHNILYYTVWYNLAGKSSSPARLYRLYQTV